MATLQSIAPIFPTSDMEAMRAHYEASVSTCTSMGAATARPLVTASASTSGDARLGSGGERGAAYLAVDDADALHAAWRAAGVGETGDLFDPGFGVWEAAHTDGDGNLLRFGSPAQP